VFIDANPTPSVSTTSTIAYNRSRSTDDIRHISRAVSQALLVATGRLGLPLPQSEDDEDVWDDVNRDEFIAILDSHITPLQNTLDDQRVDLRVLTERMGDTVKRLDGLSADLRDASSQMRDTTQAIALQQKDLETLSIDIRDLTSSLKEERGRIDGLVLQLHDINTTFRNLGLFVTAASTIASAIAVVAIFL
jgi:hypothetical protein